MKKNRMTAFASLVVAGVLGHFISAMITSPSRADVESELAEAASELQKQIPIKINDDTSLTGAVSNGRNLTYEYTIKEEVGDEGLDAMQKRYQANSDESLCNNAQFKTMLNRGVLIESRYITGDGKTFTVNSTLDTLKKCP